MLGGAGFGIGGAIAALSMVGAIHLLISVLVAGAAGGASLGLALGGLRRAIVMAALGALGLVVGILFTLSVASSVGYSPVALGALVGVVVGASLGAALLDGRFMLALGLAGAVGFGIGNSAGDLLRASFPMFGELLSLTVAGIIGGACLGGALGILEPRLPAARRGR